MIPPPHGRLQAFASLRYLYLDGCELTVEELAAAFARCAAATDGDDSDDGAGGFEPARLECLDLRGNPAEGAARDIAIAYGLNRLEWLNGRRL